jgi:hypothetical protein
LHTGLVVPLPSLERNGFHTPASVRGSQYVNFSWGSRHAYEKASWLTVPEAINVLFVPNEAVMEIIGMNYDPRFVYPAQRVYRGRLSPDAGAPLVAFLHYCGRFDRAGHLQVINKSTWGKGNLLASSHTYSFPRLCNSFTAGALESCGLRFSHWGEMTANALLASCARQGFERLPDLTDEEMRLVIKYSQQQPQ